VRRSQHPVVERRVGAPKRDRRQEKHHVRQDEETQEAWKACESRSRGVSIAETQTGGDEEGRDGGGQGEGEARRQHAGPEDPSAHRVESLLELRYPNREEPERPIRHTTRRRDELVLQQPCDER